MANEILNKLARNPQSYWDLTTKGEALLLMGDQERAADCFRAAATCPDAVEGSVAATRRQLSRLSAAKIPAAREMAEILRAHPVGVYAGPLRNGEDREADRQMLESRLNAHGLSHEAFKWYLDLRTFGSVPHAGFGMGIERAVAIKREGEHIDSPSHVLTCVSGSLPSRIRGSRGRRSRHSGG